MRGIASGIIRAPRAGVAELVDAADSKSAAERCKGSSPFPGTTAHFERSKLLILLSRFWVVVGDYHKKLPHQTRTNLAQNHHTVSLGSSALLLRVAFLCRGVLRLIRDASGKKTGSLTLKPAGAGFSRFSSRDRPIIGITADPGEERAPGSGLQL